MDEPRLEDIGDYNSLKGEKRKTVLWVIGIGLIIGSVYLLAYNVFDNKDDNLDINKSTVLIPKNNLLF